MIWDVEQKEADQSKLKVKFCGTKFNNKNFFTLDTSTLKK